MYTSLLRKAITRVPNQVGPFEASVWMFAPSLCNRRNSTNTNTNTQTHAHTQIHTTQKRTFLSMKTQCSRIILTSKFERSSSLCECVNIALVLKLSEDHLSANPVIIM